MSFIQERYKQWIRENYSLYQVGSASWEYRPVTKLAKQLDKLKFVSSVFTLLLAALFSFLYPLSIVCAVLLSPLRLAVADRLFVEQQWIWPLLLSLIVGIIINFPVFALQEPIPPNQHYRYKSLTSLAIKRLFSRDRGWLPTDYVRVNFAGFIVPILLALYQLRFSSPILIGCVTIVLATTSYFLNDVSMRRNQYNARNMQINMERMMTVGNEGVMTTINRTFSSTAGTMSLAVVFSLLSVVMLSLIFALLPQSWIDNRAVSIAFSILVLSSTISTTIHQTRRLLYWKSSSENLVKRPILQIGGIFTIPGYILCAFLAAEWIPNAINFLLLIF